MKHHIECRGKLCKQPGATCYAVSPDGLFHCTRPSKHKGPHVACGMIKHNYVIWPQPRKKAKST